MKLTKDAFLFRDRRRNAIRRGKQSFVSQITARVKRWFGRRPKGSILNALVTARRKPGLPQRRGSVAEHLERCVVVEFGHADGASNGYHQMSPVPQSDITTDYRRTRGTTHAELSARKKDSFRVRRDPGPIYIPPFGRIESFEALCPWLAEIGGSLRNPRAYRRGRHGS